MIMRLFHARAKTGQAETLVRKFSTTSADVVQNEPGNQGYFFGRGVGADSDVLIFASFWENLDAVKARFGQDWQVSFLPEGYDAMIETFWVQHVDVGQGWNVRPE